MPKQFKQLLLNMKTFKQFQEGLKTIVGLGLAGYGAYNYFKNKGKKNQQPNSNKTNDFSTDFQSGVKAIKGAKERGGILNKSTYDALNNPDF